MPKPARKTVFSLPNHGNDQLNPTAGAKLLLSFAHSFLSGSGVPGPIGSHDESIPFINPGVNSASKLFPEIPKIEVPPRRSRRPFPRPRMEPQTKKKYISIPGITHYGVYREQREQAVKYAIEWFVNI